MAEHTEVRRKVNIDKDLLAILCCPDTKQDVSLAEEAFIAKLNGAVSRGQLKNKANKLITEPLDGGLIRADRTDTVSNPRRHSCHAHRRRHSPGRDHLARLVDNLFLHLFLGQHVSYQNLPATHA